MIHIFIRFILLNLLFLFNIFFAFIMSFFVHEFIFNKVLKKFSIKFTARIMNFALARRLVRNQLSQFWNYLTFQISLYNWTFNFRGIIDVSLILLNCRIRLLKSVDLVINTWLHNTCKFLFIHVSRLRDNIMFERIIIVTDLKLFIIHLKIYKLILSLQKIFIRRLLGYHLRQVNLLLALLLLLFNSNLQEFCLQILKVVLLIFITLQQCVVVWHRKYIFKRKLTSIWNIRLREQSFTKIKLILIFIWFGFLQLRNILVLAFFWLTLNWCQLS